MRIHIEPWFDEPWRPDEIELYYFHRSLIAMTVSSDLNTPGDLSSRVPRKIDLGGLCHQG